MTPAGARAGAGERTSAWRGPSVRPTRPYRVAGGVNHDTCAATMRQPSGIRTHVYI